MNMFKRLFDIDPWKVKTTSLDRENRRLQESLTSIGNGYMGMRGNFEEQYTGDAHQGTYIAGIWYPDKTRVGWWKNGYPEYFGKVINATNFIGIDIAVNGKTIDLNQVDFDDFYLELDMKTGVLTREFTYHDNETSVKFEFERYVSVFQQELALVKVKASVLKGSAEIIFGSTLDGQVKNEDSNYDELFWEEKSRSTEDNHAYLTMETIKNDFGTPRFSVTTMMRHRISSHVAPTYTEDEKFVGESYVTELDTNQSVTLEKRVAVITTRDIPEEEHYNEAKALLDKHEEKDWQELRERHDAVWAERWEKADVMIKGDDEAQQGIRFNLFQLFATYYGEDARLNIGPKGFTGEKYGGATYWDTEAYIVPMYLSVADKQVTEQLLEYRYQQLPGAFHNAQQQGLAGALYPMVTFNGIECHNEWEITFEEVHRNAAIVHAIFNYTTYTGDESYLLDKGIEVMVAISRFWADRVHYSKRRQQYMIHGVTGPNEYENNVNNNWYTNQMATWVLRYTLETIAKLPDERLSDLSLTEKELAYWQDIINNMYYPEDEELGIFVQHDTFLDKDLTPVAELDKKHLPLNQNWSWDRVLRSPYIKQADVLQALYFLNHEYTAEEKQRNFDFYEPLTVHESSLSPCVHSILAAELGMEEKAVELYARTARLDLDNYNNDTEDGLHITSMSGSWLSIVHGFAGMRTLEEKLSFHPFLPSAWERYAFKINYRERLLEVEVDETGMTLRLSEGEPLEVFVNDHAYTLSNEQSVHEALVKRGEA
ncbi:glycoside hydrolase family 65 protein [Vagococcus lutrae]|uniref:glycoside hydrolase family 65 protein n=1 Tax=Vagococcus lutrae TaxID=81947 RepID=UPI002097DB04|nr:glycoside hydrolase family 65 protein [Vagococcus lutrae]MCO7150608.1 glycoside hydrolase family 65 protein [Vagococcus lutrae]MDT2818537.1 glycoside hydrolase family 65 protein [Vagococcus lutrae]MDT2843399.1 glycoside hydrolase family 65 protein [Vagococcus lutrae]WCG05273.1 glycoside hydrolase family 65 protein [Vagococcus lutrae]